MSIARLYYKFENDANGKAKFHYFDEKINKSNKYFYPHTTIIKNNVIQDLLERFSNRKEVLYYMNMLEYQKLIKHYNSVRNKFYDHKLSINENRADFKNKLLLDIILKREFDDWFKNNGFASPKNF